MERTLQRSNTENAGRAKQSLRTVSLRMLGRPMAHTRYLAIARCVFRPTDQIPRSAIRDPHFIYALAGCSRGLTTSVRKLPFR
jgi:hypothetical protein